MTIAERSPPVAEPLTLAEAKAHLKIDGAEEDGLIGQLITVARNHLEAETGLCLIIRPMRLYLDRWPKTEIVEIARGPVREIEAVTVYDADGTPDTVSLADHLLDGEARPARFWLRNPPLPGQAINGIEIDFTAGFGETGTDMPDTLKRAMLMHVALMHAWRGVVPLEHQPAAIPNGYERLIAPFARRRL